MLRLSSQTQQSRVRAQLELLLRNAEPGERLPSEPALAKRFDVSRTTIREVMSQLETEGFVQRRQGSGTYVRHQPLLEDESFLSSMCLDNHNEPFISSQIYSDTDYIKYQLNRRIV